MRVRLYEEARRRGIFRVAAAYLVVSWLVLEVGHILSLILELPHVVMRVVLGALVLGFRCCQSNGHLSPVSAGIPNRNWA